MNSDQWRERAIRANSDFERVGWLNGTLKQFVDHEDRMNNIIRAMCPLYGRILDVGCGYGRFCQEHLAWIGVDFCERWREEWLARRGSRGGTFIIGDAAKPSEWLINLGQFNVIVACGVIGNMGWTTEMFIDMYRHALLPGGCFVISSAYDRIEVLS